MTTIKESLGPAFTKNPMELGILSTAPPQQQQPQPQQYYPRHPAFSSNRLGGIRSQTHEAGFQVDRPLAGVLVIGGILLFVSMSLTAAVIVFCKKKNTVFVLQKSEQDDDLPADDSDLELGDFLHDDEQQADLGYFGWGQADAELRYTPLALCSLPRLEICIDAMSGQRRVRCFQSDDEEGHEVGVVSVLQNPHARDSRASLLLAGQQQQQYVSHSALDAAHMEITYDDSNGGLGRLIRSQTCTAAVHSGGSPSAEGRRRPSNRAEATTDPSDVLINNETDEILRLRLMSHCDQETEEETEDTTDQPDGAALAHTDASKLQLEARQLTSEL